MLASRKDAEKLLTPKSCSKVAEQNLSTPSKDAHMGYWP